MSRGLRAETRKEVRKMEFDELELTSGEQYKLMHEKYSPEAYEELLNQ